MSLLAENGVEETVCSIPQGFLLLCSLVLLHSVHVSLTGVVFVAQLHVQSQSKAARARSSRRCIGRALNLQSLQVVLGTIHVSLSDTSGQA